MQNIPLAFYSSNLKLSAFGPKRTHSPLSSRPKLLKDTLEKPLFKFPEGTVHVQKKKIIKKLKLPV